jgi:hypothetical protein
MNYYLHIVTIAGIISADGIHHFLRVIVDRSLQGEFVISPVLFHALLIFYKP